MTKQVRNFNEAVELARWFDGMSLGDCLTSLSDMIEKYGPGATYTFTACDGYIEEEITVKREETDREYALRLHSEKARNDRIEQAERAELAKLKEKYGE